MTLLLHPVANPPHYGALYGSFFNRIIGDGRLELRFAGFLEGCSDVVSYAKNYLAVHFRLDYVDEESFDKYRPASFRQLLKAFREYKPA